MPSLPSRPVVVYPAAAAPISLPAPITPTKAPYFQPKPMIIGIVVGVLLIAIVMVLLYLNDKKDLTK
jgi:hypothetical protein